MTLAHKLLDAEDALDMGMRLVRDGQEAPEAAIAVYRAGLNPEAASSFAIIGIIARLNERIGRDRTTAIRWGGTEVGAEIEYRDGAAPSGRNLPKSKHHAKALWEHRLAVRYWTPDGRKRLLDFTLSDVRYLAGRFGSTEATLRERRRAMELAEKLMVSRKVDFLRLLPADDKAAIAEAIR